MRWRPAPAAGAASAPTAAHLLTPTTPAKAPCSLFTAAQTFIRAVLCNWLVCLAVWQAFAATTLSGKMLGLWGPIAAFVAIGLVSCNRRVPGHHACGCGLQDAPCHSDAHCIT